MNSTSSHKNKRSTCNAITTSGNCGMHEPAYNPGSKRARIPDKKADEHKAKEHEVLSEDKHEPPVVAPSSRTGTPHEYSLLPLPSTPPLPSFFNPPRPETRDVIRAQELDLFRLKQTGKIHSGGPPRRGLRQHTSGVPTGASSGALPSLSCWRRGREAGAATERALPPTVDIVDSACWPRLLKSKRAILDEPGWGAQVYLFSDQCVLPCCEQPRRTCVHTRLSQVASDMSRSGQEAMIDYEARGSQVDEDPFCPHVRGGLMEKTHSVDWLASRRPRTLVNPRKR